MSWLCPSALGANNVLTNNADNARSGFYKEFELSPTNVNAGAITTFGKIHSWQTDGQIYAQPLYVHGILMLDGQTHNVVFVATETNNVYAFDVETFAVLWGQMLGEPVLWGAGGCGKKNLFPKTGVTSTPGIDLAGNVIGTSCRCCW
jgi:hypothetical protein